MSIIRSKPKNLAEATRYPFMKQTGVLSDTSAVGHDMDNGSALTWSNAAGLYSVEGMKVDSASRLIVGRTAVQTTFKTVKISLNANALMVDQCIWIADQAYEVSGAYEVHATAGNDASAVTIDITKESSGTVPGAGTSVLASPFNAKATANTVQLALPATTQSALSIAAGDRISLNFTGTPTSLAGVVIELLLTPGCVGDHAIFALQANGSLSDQCFYTATQNRKITGIKYVHATAGTDGSAVNLQVTKDTGTDAPGAGTNLLTNNTNAGFDCKGTINVVQTGALSATAANLRLAPGDRLSVDFAGTLTALAGVVVVVTFEPLYETQDVSFNLAPTASLLDQPIYIATRPCKVIAISQVHATANGGAANLQVTLDRETDAPGAGSDLVSLNANAGFNINATANTVQVATFVSDGLNVMYTGDRLSLDFSGSIVSLAGLELTVTLQSV